MRPLLYRRSEPICPGIFVPGQTRALSRPVPIVPPLLWNLVAPWEAGPPLKPQRFTTPWNPWSTLHQKLCFRNHFSANTIWKQVDLRFSIDIYCLPNEEMSCGDGCAWRQSCVGCNDETRQCLFRHETNFGEKIAVLPGELFGGKIVFNLIFSMELCIGLLNRSMFNLFRICSFSSNYQTS